MDEEDAFIELCAEIIADYVMRPGHPQVKIKPTLPDLLTNKNPALPGL
jgi:predicted transcriptional regulator